MSAAEVARDAWFAASRERVAAQDRLHAAEVAVRGVRDAIAADALNGQLPSDQLRGVHASARDEEAAAAAALNDAIRVQDTAAASLGQAVSPR